jgi:hypothetical protein
VNTHVTKNTGISRAGIHGTGGGSLKLDTLSRVTGNATEDEDGVGGIDAQGLVELPSADNVTGNTPINCRGNGITGPGAVCLTT